MRILFDIGHPADIHLFKHIILNLKEKNNEIKICVRERENISKKLLELYNFEYEELEKNVPGLFNKAITMFKNDYKLIDISKRFNPNIFVSLASPYSAQVSRLMNRYSITFTDSEPTRLMLSLTMPFTDVILTPKSFTINLGEKQIRINSFKELAYLHPNWFKPNPDVLDLLNISKGEKYVICRFGAFDASHDIGIKGFSLEDKIRLIEKLSKYTKIFISSELKLPRDLERYDMNIPQHRMHDAMYYASLLVGDTQTSTTEAACLGTPAIRCNSFVGPNDMSNFKELEAKYKLIFNYRDSRNAIEKSLDIIQQENIKKEWAQRTKKLINDKIDLTAFMTWFIKNYPKSFEIVRCDPTYQERFK